MRAQPQIVALRNVSGHDVPVSSPIINEKGIVVSAQCVTAWIPSSLKPEGSLLPADRVLTLSAEASAAQVCFALHVSWQESMSDVASACGHTGGCG